MNKYYWFVMLDNIVTVLGCIAFFSGVACVIFTVIYLISKMDTKDKADEKDKAKVKSLRRWLISCILLFIIFITAATLVPNTKQMAAIVLLPKVVENKQMNKLPENVAKLANDWIIELSPKTNKGGDI